MSVQSLSTILILIQTIVLTRVFGSEAFGLFSFALSISALAVLIFSAGLDQVLMRDIARIGKGVMYSDRWKGTLRLIKLYVIPIALIFSTCASITIWFTKISGDYQLPLLAVFLMLPFVIARKYTEAISLGTKQAIRSITGSQIVYPLLMILGGGFIYILGVQSGALSISLIYSLACIVSLIASFLLISSALRQMRLESPSLNSSQAFTFKSSKCPSDKELLISGIHFSLVSMGFVLGQHINVLLMGVFSSPENVAIVRIASRVAEMAALMRTIILLQYKPLMAEAYGKGDTKLLQEHATLMVKLCVLTGIPITIFLWVFAAQVMAIFGPEFVEGAWVMRVYIVGVLLLILCGPCNSILALTGNEQHASKLVWIGILVNVVLCITLIPKWGALGCAVASSTSMLVFGFLSVRAARRLIQVETSILGVFGHRP